MAYAEVSTLRSYLAITDTSDDALLSAQISRAQQAIDKITNTAFESSTNTNRTFDSVRDVQGRLLKLDRDLASINSITNGDGSTVSSSDYVTEPRNDTPYYGILIKASASIRWEPDSSGNTENAITVSGLWAYSTTAPADIVHATVRLAAWFYRQRDNIDMERAFAVTGGVILPSTFPSDVLSMLQAYKRRM